MLQSDEAVMYDAVAIDGPAGSGKSTIAKEVAMRLGFLYIDTGAMYRSVALKALRLGIELEDENAMANVARGCTLGFSDDGTSILLDGENVSAEIRTPQVTDITRYAARAPKVREHLVSIQRQMAQQRPAVMEGRDITTVVLPRARWRFFLTASAEERATRRMKDFQQRGHAVDYNELLTQINERDASDNAVGPMKEAQELARDGKGINLVDTTGMSIGQVIEYIISCIRK